MSRDPISAIAAYVVAAAHPTSGLPDGGASRPLPKESGAQGASDLPVDRAGHPMSGLPGSKFDTVEGRGPPRPAPVPPYAHGKTAREQGGASS
jgi:hypothetical protein